MLSLLLVVLSAAPGPARALALARGSPDATRAFAELERRASAIPDRGEARTVRAMLENPAPTFITALADPRARAQVRDTLVREGLLDETVTVEALFPRLPDPARAPQPFLGAPRR